MSIFCDGISTYIDVQNPDVPSGTRAMTMCAFFTHSTNGDDRIISKADGETVEDHFWKIGVNVTNNFQMRLTTTIGSINLAGNTTIVTGDQYFGAGVYTGAVCQLWLARMPVNNPTVVLDGQVSQTGVVAVDPAVGARIGDNPVGERHWLGSLADVRVYDRALSQDELQNIVIEVGQDAILDGLLYRWPLNEGADGEVPTGTGVMKDHGESKLNGTPFGNITYRDALPFVEKPILY